MCNNLTTEGEHELIGRAYWNGATRVLGHWRSGVSSKYWLEVSSEMNIVCCEVGGTAFMAR
jgi:hypothetical protein